MPITLVTRPKASPDCSEVPWLKTSQGETPKPARIIMLIEKP